MHHRSSPAPRREPPGTAPHPGLKGRQITMISIGGVIGAGLFVGSSTAVAAAGPAVLISFLLAAALVVLVMQMLGEMAVAHPDTGSFSTYADRALGRWAGFSIGWLYWWFYILVIPIEAIAAGEVLGGLLAAAQLDTGPDADRRPGRQQPLAVRNYGEFEYWFALLKVIAIVAFLALGVLAVLGLLPGSDARGVGHLWSEGGFAPKGGMAVSRRAAHRDVQFPRAARSSPSPPRSPRSRGRTSRRRYVPSSGGSGSSTSDRSSSSSVSCHGTRTRWPTAPTKPSSTA